MSERRRRKGGLLVINVHIERSLGCELLKSEGGREEERVSLCVSYMYTGKEVRNTANKHVKEEGRERRRFKENKKHGRKKSAAIFVAVLTMYRCCFLFPRVA